MYVAVHTYIHHIHTYKHNCIDTYMRTYMQHETYTHNYTIHKHTTNLFELLVCVEFVSVGGVCEPKVKLVSAGWLGTDRSCRC